MASSSPPTRCRSGRSASESPGIVSRVHPEHGFAMTLADAERLRRIIQRAAVRRVANRYAVPVVGHGRGGSSRHGGSLPTTSAHTRNSRITSNEFTIRPSKIMTRRDSIYESGQVVWDQPVKICDLRSFFARLDHHPAFLNDEGLNVRTNIRKSNRRW